MVEVALASERNLEARNGRAIDKIPALVAAVVIGMGWYRRRYKPERIRETIWRRAGAPATSLRSCSMGCLMFSNNCFEISNFRDIGPTSAGTSGGLVAARRGNERATPNCFFQRQTRRFHGNRRNVHAWRGGVRFSYGDSSCRNRWRRNRV